ncbi:hypothetical protein ACIBPB_27255 [Micromonospora sp. NPDC049836]|uniref:hypothetical protein n=1 Tax=Micromonospora sp. NPDC049836 TaxID=3364274 RepID=UPI0037A9DAC3
MTASGPPSVGRRPGRVRDRWPCRCGGHLVIRCRMCADVQVEPRVGADCDARDHRAGSG